MKLSSLFSCFRSSAKKQATKKVQQEAQAVASSASQTVAKDTIALSSSPVSRTVNTGATTVSSGQEANQKLQQARESLKEIAKKRELLEAQHRQRALLKKAKSDKNFKMAEKLEAMSVEDFNKFHKGFKQRQAAQSLQ